jgi:hypothetical protein
VLEIFDDGCALATILETKRHVIIRDNTVRFRQPLIEGQFIPLGVGLLHRIRVAEGLNGTGRSSENTPETGSDLVCIEGMTAAASRLKHLLAGTRAFSERLNYERKREEQTS